MHIRNLLTAASVLALVALTYLSNPFIAVGQTTQPWPRATSCSVTTTSAQCIGLNPTRRAIEICNVSQAVVWIAPSTSSSAATAVANTGNSYPLPAISSNVASCYRTPAQISQSAGSAWSAISVTSSSVLAIYEY